MIDFETSALKSLSLCESLIFSLISFSIMANRTEVMLRASLSAVLLSARNWLE